MSQLNITFPPPRRGRARVGVEMCYFDRANPHPNLPPDGTTSHSTKLANNASQVAGYARGKGQLCSNGVLL
jgi:hypothetical protein